MPHCLTLTYHRSLATFFHPESTVFSKYPPAPRGHWLELAATMSQTTVSNSRFIHPEPCARIKRPFQTPVRQCDILAADIETQSQQARGGPYSPQAPTRAPGPLARLPSQKNKNQEAPFRALHSLHIGRRLLGQFRGVRASGMVWSIVRPSSVPHSTHRLPK